MWLTAPCLSVKRKLYTNCTQAGENVAAEQIFHCLFLFALMHWRTFQAN